MKVLLFTLTGFGNKVLDALLDSSCDVSYIYTRKSTQKFKFYDEIPITRYAKNKGIQVFDTFTWEDIENTINDYKPDLLLVASFHKIIPKSIIDMVPICVNLHPSLLPKYRGPNPIQWVIFKNETTTGVSAHILTKDIDAGDILIQEKLKVHKKDNENTLMKRLAILAGKTTNELIKQIKDDNLKPRKQDLSKARYMPKINLKSAIVVIGGALIQDKKGTYHTCSFSEKGDIHGYTGDRLRVEAAACLHKKYPDKILIASGGRGQVKIGSNEPAVSTVIAAELQKFGIIKDMIIKETRSTNTFAQLKELSYIFKNRGLTDIIMISNKYHLPRIKELIKNIPELNNMKLKKQIRVMSAEDILIKDKPSKWDILIKKAYDSPEIKARIKLERNGVQQIKNGSYK